jgi:hypothetical protein
VVLVSQIPNWQAVKLELKCLELNYVGTARYWLVVHVSQCLSLGCPHWH